MTGEQLVNAGNEFLGYKKELSAVANGFGLEGLTITVMLKDARQFELAELEVRKRPDSLDPHMVRGVGKYEGTLDADGKPKPPRWFAVHLDHEQIAWIEFETWVG